MNKLCNEFFRLLRFGLVGGSSAVVYAAVLLALVHFLGTGSMVSSALAYVAAIPVSFFGQKYFTFQSQGNVKRELPAYLLLQGVNLIASVFVTYTVVDLVGMSHYLGILAVVSVITLISYAAMALAIFR
jgi:putative flippase GtrA